MLLTYSSLQPTDFIKNYWKQQENNICGTVMLSYTGAISWQFSYHERQVVPNCWKKISIFIFVTEIVTSWPGSTLILSSHHNAPWTCGSVAVTPTHVYANVYLAELSEFRYRSGEKGTKQKPAPGLAHTAALLQFPFIIAVDAPVIGCDLRPDQNVRDVISFYGPSFLQLQASVTHSDYQNELFDTHYARRGKPHMR